MTDAPSPAPILLCEDDPHDLFFAQRLIKRVVAGHPVLVATDGEKAVQSLQELAAQQLPALVLLDIRMPRRTGFEVLEWARTQPALREVPFVMMTGSGLDQDVTRARELGAKAFLTKYPSPEEFADMLRRFTAVQLLAAGPPAS